MPPKPDWMAAQGRPWTRANETTQFDNPWLAVRTYEAVAPTGAPAHYGVVHFKNRAIGILPLFDNGDTLLVGQHRFPLADYSWEIPEGGGPLEEAPLAAAQRELREETGLVAQDWRPVMAFQLSNSVTDEQGFGFIAMGLSMDSDDPDETEVLTVKRLPFREALDLALAGYMADMITLAMLLRAYHMAREGELPRQLAQNMLQMPGAQRLTGGEDR